MKIVYLHQYYNEPNMSGSTRSFEFCRRLVERGHEVHVVTTSRDKPGKKERWKVTRNAGVIVHWVPIHYNNNMKFFSRMKAFISFSILAFLGLFCLNQIYVLQLALLSR